MIIKSTQRVTMAGLGGAGFAYVEISLPMLEGVALAPDRRETTPRQLPIRMASKPAPRSHPKAARVAWPFGDIVAEMFAEGAMQ